MSKVAPRKVHPAVLARCPGCSVKGPPENNTMRSLADEILKDGFVTSSEPMMVLFEPLLMMKHVDSGNPDVSVSEHVKEW